MPAGAHSVKKPSQHSLIIIITFAYIFSVSGGSAAALKTIKNMTIRIPDGNAFRIRLTARNLISGEYTEAADLSNIDNLVINYVRRGIRFPHAYTIDEEGRATVADAGTLDCGFYGIELTGYYGGEKFRFYGKDLFEITTDTTDVIDPSNLIDIEITVKLNASGVSKDYVDHAVNGMEASMETMQADLRDEIAEAGKVDDVKVNGVSVVSGKKAIITVPTKVSDLTNDSGYQNEQQVQQKVDDAKITSADISVDGGTGTPSGSAGVSGNKLVIALHNIKGEKGDPGESIVGPQGPQGATSVYDQTTQDFLTTLETTTGDSQTKTMTQKAVTDAIVSQIEKKEDIPDLALTDEQENAIVVFRRGHVKTKNFDSEKMANAAMSSDNQHADLTLEDESGNAVAIFENGHVKTKNFDSRNIVPNKKSDYEGMRISILGDSISTFGTSYEEGIEAAQANDKGDWTWVGNRCRYPQANLFVDVKYQYWYLLIERLGLVLGVNESWAGSRISNTSETDTGDVGPNRHMASLTRIGHLGENGTPDIILVYGGTNDAGNNVPIGTFDTSNPKNLTEDDIASLPVATFADAYRAMLIRLQYYYPYARIICLFPNFTTSYYSMTSLDDYEEIIREECDFFGVEYVDLRTAGVNFKNSSSYLTDGIHPNAEGMRLIYKRLLKTVFN